MRIYKIYFQNIFENLKKCQKFFFHFARTMKKIEETLKQFSVGEIFFFFEIKYR